MGSAVIAAIDGGEPGDEAAQALRLLHARGCARVFVEGGGVTVSRFLEANLLDRLQIAIAPVLIGEGRPAVRLSSAGSTAGLPPARLPGVPHGRRRAVRLRLSLQADAGQNVVPGTVNRII